MGYWAEMIAICFSIFWEVTRWPFNDNWNVAKMGLPELPTIYLSPIFAHWSVSVTGSPPSIPRWINFPPGMAGMLILHDFAPSLPVNSAPKRHQGHLAGSAWWMPSALNFASLHPSWPSCCGTLMAISWRLTWKVEEGLDYNEPKSVVKSFNCQGRIVLMILIILGNGFIHQLRLEPIHEMMVFNQQIWGFSHEMIGEWWVHG